MLNINYWQIRIVVKNILLAIAAFLFINILLHDRLGSLLVYQDILLQAFVYGGLVGLAAGVNEIMIDHSIRKKAAQKKLLVEKVALRAAPLYYVRLMRVFILGSVLCLACVGITSWVEGYSLSVYTQLAVIPVSLALGANVPQTYAMYVRLGENRQEVLNVIQQTLDDSVFEVEFRDHHHLVYKIADQWQHMYTYFLAPDRCTIEVLIHREYVEIVGAYRYLDSMMDDKYIQLITRPKEEDQQEKVA